jgi:hypothetical protein
MSLPTGSVVCRSNTKPIQEKKMLIGTENLQKCTYSTISKIDVILQQNVEKRMKKNIIKTVPVAGTDLIK